MAFCLDDGSPLLSSYNSEATQVIPVDRVTNGATLPSIPLQAEPRRRQTVASQAIPNGDRKTNPLLYVIIALLALIAGGGLVALLMFVRSSPASNQIANVPANNQQDARQQQDLQNQQAELDRERQRLEDERKKLESQKTKPAETAAVDSAARITFRRGSVQETIPGVVARSKSYVLKAKAGQSLSATVTSNGCVVFNTGSTSMDSVTTSGDNWITVVNNCAAQAPFNLTVYIR